MVVERCRHSRWSRRDDCDRPMANAVDEAERRAANGVEIAIIAAAVVEHDRDGIIGEPDREDVTQLSAITNDEVVWLDVKNWSAVRISDGCQKQATRYGVLLSWRRVRMKSGPDCEGQDQ